MTDIGILLRQLKQFASPAITRTVSVHSSISDAVARLLERVDKCLILCKGLFISNNKTQEWTQWPALQNDSVGENYKKQLLSAFHLTKSTQTNGSFFAVRIEHFVETDFELEQSEKIDSFLYSNGKFSSNLLQFQLKSPKTYHSLQQRDLYKSNGSAKQFMNASARTDLTCKVHLPF